MVRGAHGGREVGQPRRHLALQMADPGRAQRLVQGGPHLDAVPEPLGDDTGVRGERERGVALRPAAPVLEHLRQVPVVEGDGGSDAGREQRVDQPVVEVEPLGVDSARAARHHARPGHRQPVGVGAQPAHQLDVLLPAVVVVAGHVAVVPACDLAGGVRVGVPDGGRAAVLGGGPLDLVRRGGRAPQEVAGEGAEVDGHGGPFGDPVQSGAGCGHLTAPAVRPATRYRWSSRNPATTGTLTTSEAAMIWFQYTSYCVE